MFSGRKLTNHKCRNRAKQTSIASALEQLVRRSVPDHQSRSERRKLQGENVTVSGKPAIYRKAFDGEEMLVSLPKSAKKITRLGLEPRMSEPKSEVLPLHHRVICKDFNYFPPFFTTAKASCSSSMAKSTPTTLTDFGKFKVTGAKFRTPDTPLSTRMAATSAAASAGTAKIAN